MIVKKFTILKIFRTFDVQKRAEAVEIQRKISGTGRSDFHSNMKIVNSKCVTICYNEVLRDLCLTELPLILYLLDICIENICLFNQNL